MQVGHEYKNVISTATFGLPKKAKEHWNLHRFWSGV